MNKKCYVIGVFPPPYGGVTIKCKLFEQFLDDEGYIVDSIDIYKISKGPKAAACTLSRCFKAFRSGSNIVYCLDTKRLRLLLNIQRFFKKSLGNTTVLAVGGVFHEIVSKDASLKRNLQHVKGLWVETDGMKNKLREMGLNNVEVFPNPKSEIGSCAPQKSVKSSPLKLVYFSQISTFKGADSVMDMVGILNERYPDVSFTIDFYGHVLPEFKNEFEKFVDSTPNVQYCGVFDATKASVYVQLNSYDLLLFPTTWYAEGVPGILVEAKMAGISVIASDRSFNNEIIREENKEGFLVKQNYGEEMATIVHTCFTNRELLNETKSGSYDSKERYSLRAYKDMLALL